MLSSQRRAVCQANIEHGDNKLNWSDYEPYFKKSEFDCKETGENGMRPEFMGELLKLRKLYGKPMIVNSGYRSARHSIERKKGHSNGEHVQGLCADISCNGNQAFEMIKVIFENGLKFNRIGINQKGASGRFLHIGMGSPTLPNDTVWSY